MSISVDQQFITTFTKEVHLAYQGGFKNSLRQAAINKTCKGDTCRFQKLGVGAAHERVHQADVQPMNVVHSNVNALMVDYEAPEYSDRMDMEKINFDERQPLVKTISGAIGRRMDQIWIDAAVAAATAKNVPKTIGTNTAMDPTKLRRAKKLLDDDEVPEEDRFFVHGTAALEQLLGNTPVTSGDFSQVMALNDGTLKKWLGFTFLMVGTRPEGGLPISGTDRTAFACHKSALGLGINMEEEIAIDRIPHKVSWLTNGIFSAGGIAIQAEGLVTVVSDEAIIISS